MLRRHRGPVSGEILAREAGISLRTLYRDIAALQAMGADIEGAPGFGYILKPRFMLPPWCELRADFRHFRTDRIEACEPLSDRLPKRRRALLQHWRTVLSESDRGMAHKNAPTLKEDSFMTKELIFYTNPQSRAAIVHWALEEIGCAYTVKVLDFGTTMKAPDYLAINPMGKVPAIKHGETIVTEVAAILAYLADTFPEAGLAPDVSARGDYYRWIFFTADCLLNAVNNNMRGCNPAPEQYVQAGYGCYEHVLDAVSGLVKDKATIASDKFTMADLLLASYLDFFMKFDMIEKRPEYEAYCAPHIARPAGKCAQEAVAKLMKEKAFAAT